MNHEGNKLYCETHATEQESHENFEDILSFNHGYKENMTKLEEEIVRAQCLAAFTDMDNASTQIKDLNSEIQEKFSEMLKRSKDLSDQSEFGEYSKMSTDSHHLLEMCDNFHREIGYAIARELSASMFQEVSNRHASEGDTKQTKYNFTTLFAGESEFFDNLKKKILSSMPASKRKPSKDTHTSSTEVVKGDLEKELESYKERLRDLEDKYKKEREHSSKMKKHRFSMDEVTPCDTDRIMPLMKDNLHIVPELLNESTVLTLWCNKSGDRNFIEHMGLLVFPKIQSLAITHLEDITKKEDIYAINKFMTYSFVKPFDTVSISAEKDTELAKVAMGLKNVCSLGKNQVLVRGVKIDSLTMKEVFESSRDTHMLVFYDCTIADLEGFKLDHNLDYNIKVLDLFETADCDNKEKLNRGKMIPFVEALGKTSLKDSVKRIHVHGDLYDPKEVEELFTSHGFTASICGSEKWPYASDHDHARHDIQSDAL